MKINIKSCKMHSQSCGLKTEISTSSRYWDPLNWFNPATLVCLFQSRIWIYNARCCGLYCVQFLKLWSSCLPCWYWWNCWPSLFKNFLVIIYIPSALPHVPVWIGPDSLEFRKYTIGSHDNLWWMIQNNLSYRERFHF